MGAWFERRNRHRGGDVADGGGGAPEVVEAEIAELSTLLDARNVDRATYAWTESTTSAQSIKGGLVVACDHWLAAIETRRPDLTIRLADAQGTTTREASAKLLWAVILHCVGGSSESKLAGSRQPILATYLLLGLGDANFFPRWATDKSALGTRSDPWPVFGATYGELLAELPENGRSALASWNHRNVGFRRALATLAYGPPYPSRPQDAFKPGSRELRRLAMDLRNALLATLESRDEIATAVAAFDDLDSSIKIDPIGLPDKRPAWLLTASIISAVVFLVVSLTHLDLTPKEEESRYVEPAGRVLSARDSPFRATSAGVRNLTVGEKRASRDTEIALGDDLEFAVEAPLGDGVGDNDTMEYLRIRQTIPDREISESPGGLSYAFFLVSQSGVERLVRGSQFTLSFAENDNCSRQENRVVIHSVRQIEDQQPDFTFSVDMKDAPLGAPAPAYLLGSASVFVGAVMEFAESAPLRFEGRMRVEPRESTPGPFDQGPLTFRVNGQETDGEATTRIGDVVTLVVSLHRGGCGYSEVTPRVRIAQAVGDGSGFVQLSASVTDFTAEDQADFRQGRINVVDTRRPRLDEVEGSAKFWKGGCNGPEVIESLPPGILSGGITVGPVPEFLPRDDCELHARWITVDAIVVGAQD